MTSKFCSKDKIIENLKDLKIPEYSLYDGEYEKGISNDLSIESLIFAGGGVVGISYLGVLQALKEKKLLNKIKYWIGSSSGAIIATLVAFGATNEFILGKLSSVNLSSLFTVVGHELNYKNCFDKYLVGYYALPELIMNLGLCSSQPFITWFTECIQELGHSSEMTFAELYDKTGIHLMITTSNLNCKTTMYLSRSSYPHMRVIDAVNASILLPFIFQPLKMYDPNYSTSSEAKDKPIYCSDGGLLDNLAINACDVLSDSGEVIGFNRKTVAFLPVDNGNFYPDYVEITNILEYTMAVLKTLHNSVHLAQTHQPYFWERTVPIETANIDATDFDISKEKITFLIASGYKATMIYLNRREKMILEKGPLPNNLFIPNLRLQTCGIEYISDNCIADTQMYKTNPVNFTLNKVVTAHLFQ